MDGEQNEFEREERRQEELALRLDPCRAFLALCRLHGPGPRDHTADDVIPPAAERDLSTIVLGVLGNRRFFSDDDMPLILEGVMRRSWLLLQSRGVFK